MARVLFQRAICTALVVALLIASSQAATATIYASADATVYAANQARANSLGSYLWVGTTDGEARTLLKFTDFSAIPAGSTINSANLRLVNTDFLYNGAASTIEVYLINTDWAEGSTSTAFEFDNGKTGFDAAAGSGDPTWSHKSYNTITWTTPGVDASLTPVATYSLGTTDSTPISGSLTTTASSWLTSSAGNYGILLRATGALRRLGSRETIDSNKVALIIDYTPSGGSSPPPPTPTASSGTGAPTKAVSAPRNVIDFTKPAPGTDGDGGATASGGGLSGGAIAGIVCGVIAVLVIVIRIVLICLLR